jgi:hypothetical protein
VESTRAGRSKESPEDSGPGADCGFASPQRKVTSGPNAVERIIINISAAVHRRPRGSPGGTNPGRVVKNLCRSPVAVTSSKIFFLTKIASVNTPVPRVISINFA